MAGLQFDESIQIDLEENMDSNFATIRELIEYITFECANMDNVTDLAKKLRHEHFNDNVRKQIKSITVSDVVGIAIGLAGLILIKFSMLFVNHCVPQTVCTVVYLYILNN